MTGRTQVTYQQVAAKAEQLEIAGVDPQPKAIHELLGKVGDVGMVEKYLAQWKNSRKSNHKIISGKETVDELRRSLALVRSTLESTEDGILILDRTGSMVDWNQKFVELLKVPQEVLESGNEKEGIRFIINYVEEPEAFLKMMMRINSKPEIKGDMGDCRTVDGRIFERYTQPHIVNGNIVGRVWSFRDVTKRRMAEEELRLRERAIESTSQGIAITENNPELTITYVNPAFETITGYSKGDIYGRGIDFLFGHDVQQAEIKSIRNAQREQTEEEVVLRCYRSDGLLFWNEMHLAPVVDPDGKITHYVLIINDITERKAMEGQLMHQATHDTLTDLPNRVLLQDRIRQAILYAQRDNSIAAVLFIDLDRFKLINDSLGHNMGDSLLCVVSNRLKGCLRATDTVARIGGDEFVVILSPIFAIEDIVHITQKIIAAMRLPFQIEERELSTTASVGITCYPRDGYDAATLIRNADTAMYHAKDLGRDNFQFFTDEMNRVVSHRLVMENNLRHALDQNEFYLNYQPIIHLSDYRVTGVEALLRWENEHLGRISPVEFIPVAEEMGLIIPIGRWVLKTACLQLKEWEKKGLKDIQVSVNVSGRQLSQENFAEMVLDILQETQLNPQFLVLELTESMLMDHTDNTLKKLNKLREYGVKLAIDDFGTGYSSLSYLKRLPVDKLKIDRAFVGDIGVDPNDEAIVMAIIAMSKTLSLGVIAEGAQTKQQMDFLQKYQCDEVQGYYFSKPLKAEACTTLLLENYGLLGKQKKG